MEVKEILICRFTRSILKVCLLWPFDGDFQNRQPFFCAFSSMILVSLIYFVLLLRHFLMLLEEGKNNSEDITVILTFCNAYAMVFTYLRKQKKFRQLLFKLSDFEKFEKPPEFDALNQRIDFFGKCFYIYGVLGFIVATLQKLSTISECRSMNRHENCGLLIPTFTSKIISFQDTPVAFIFFWGVHFVVSKFVLFVTPLLSFILFELCQHLILKIEHLNTKLVKCFDGNSAENRRKFNQCVAYHIEIINLVKKLNGCLSDTMFVHLVFTATICASIENHIVKESHIIWVVFLLAWIVTLFIICTSGQQLMDASLTVGDAAYASRWYAADIKLQKDLILLIKRSQHPLRVQTGSFDTLTYPLFVSLMKLSYSVFALLNTV